MFQGPCPILRQKQSPDSFFVAEHPAFSPVVAELEKMIVATSAHSETCANASNELVTHNDCIVGYNWFEEAVVQSWPDLIRDHERGNTKTTRRRVGTHAGFKLKDRSGQ